MKTEEEKERELIAYNQNKLAYAELYNGGVNITAVKRIVDGEEVVVLAKAEGEDAQSLADRYDALMFRHVELDGMLRSKHAENIESLEREKASVYHINTSFSEQIERLKEQIKNLKERNWFHKLFNL